MSKRRCDNVHFPLDTHIRERRQQLCRQKQEELPKLQAALQSLLKTYDALGNERRTMRVRRDTALELDALRDAIAFFESDGHIKRFEESVAPFVDAYNKQTVQRRRTNTIAVPGANDTASFETVHEKATQYAVVSEYLSQHQLQHTVQARTDVCPQCTRPMVLIPSKAIVACKQCGRIATFLDATSNSIAFDDAPDMVTFAYKRSNHFSDWVTHAQYKETYRVSDGVMEAVMNELYKQRVRNIDEITTRRVRDVLKSLKERRNYDYTCQIVCRLTGRPPPTLPAEAEELLKLMFQAIQEPFQRHCPAWRKNFLSYAYILSKILYLLGYDELCDTLQQLKGRDKLQKMDAIWQLITNDLDWQFFPST